MNIVEVMRLLDAISFFLLQFSYHELLPRKVFHDPSKIFIDLFLFFLIILIFPKVFIFHT